MNRHVAERPTPIRADAGGRMPNPDGLRVMSEAELVQLLRRFGETRGWRGFTTAEATWVASWGNQVRTMDGILGLVLEGRVGIDVLDGEVLFIPPTEGDHAER